MSHPVRSGPGERSAAIDALMKASTRDHFPALLVQVGPTTAHGEPTITGREDELLHHVLGLDPGGPIRAGKVERETGFEPATSSLEGWRSTN